MEEADQTSLPTSSPSVIFETVDDGERETTVSSDISVFRHSSHAFWIESRQFSEQFRQPVLRCIATTFGSSVGSDGRTQCCLVTLAAATNQEMRISFKSSPSTILRMQG
jgi:hypothetical protein